MPIYYTKPVLSFRERAVFALGCAAVGMTVGILFYDSPILGVVISLILGLGALPSYKENLGNKHRMELLVQFRDLLYSISASISSGRNMRNALEEAKLFCAAAYEKQDYIMRELDYMTQKLENGNEIDTVVLRDFADRSGLSDIEDFAEVYENCKESGGDLKAAISRATTLIGDKIELESELKSLLAQKLFEGRIVGAAPFAVVLMIKITAPEYMEAMTSTRQGLVLTTLALVLTAAAVRMTERIHKIEI